jgi:dolichol-phosphate mannosyltransferase
MSGERGLVVIPTYDEAENIELVLDRVRACVPSFDVLVVDDSSPDGTGDLADKVAAHDERVSVLHRTAERGLGSAYLAGFAWGLERGFDIFVEMDADGSHLPEQLPRLLDALVGADLVLGARWVPGGRVVNWPTSRELLSRGGNVYARMALGLPVQGLDLRSVASQGYCFQVDLARRAVEAGFTVVEVPITFVEREHGYSKMSGSIVREALVRVTAWGVHHRASQLKALLGGRQHCELKES